jgi:hypothetical protein
MTKKELEKEALRMSELLQGKVVSKVFRNRESEIIIAFDDGTRLFVDESESGLEFSIT